MNCPFCRSGILELAGELKLRPVSTLEDVIQFETSPNDSPFKLNLYICSKDNCNFTRFEANKEFLPLLKEQRYREYQKLLSI